MSSERVPRALDGVQGELGASSASWQRWVLNVTEMSCNLRSDGGLVPSHFMPGPEWQSESRNEAGETDLRDPWGLSPFSDIGQVGCEAESWPIFFRAGVWTHGKAPTHPEGAKDTEKFSWLRKTDGRAGSGCGGSPKGGRALSGFDCQAATLQRCMSFCGSCTIAGAGTASADGQPCVLIRWHGATLYPSGSSSGGRHKTAALPAFSPPASR